MQTTHLSLFDDANRMAEENRSAEVRSRKAMRAAGFINALKGSMFRAAKASPLSRDQIVDEMNELAAAAGRRLTQGRAKGIARDTLDKWLATEDVDHVPSIYAVHVFCLALDDPSPLRFWLEAMFGETTAGPDILKLAEYARGVLEHKLRTKRQRTLEDHLISKLEATR